MNKSIKSLLIATGAVLCGMATEKILAEKDASKCIPYGSRVDTPYGKMNVSQTGSQGPVIVLLSGYGTASPILDFQPLAKQLSAFSKVVSIEYLGYGYSDISNRERTVHNICEEIHAVLESLHYDRYYLMAHSISGVYALYYQNMYENEVCGIIGIDPSVPNQIDFVDAGKEPLLSAVLKKSGIMRLINVCKPGTFVPSSDDYDAQSIATIKGMLFSQRHNPTIADEGKRINENFELCRTLTYPKHLPILMMLSSRNCDRVSWWKTIHEEQLCDHDHAKIIVMDGAHYLHWTQSKAMSEAVKQFLCEECVC